MMQSATLSPTLTREIEAQRDYLVRYARSQVNDPHTAEDLAQDTLLAALTSASRFEQRSALRTWLTGILRHKIIDMRRANGREVNFSSFGEDAERDLPDANFVGAGWGRLSASAPNDPFTRLAHKRFMEDLRASMKTLPPNQCSALVMREVQGHDTIDICRTLGVSSTNLWVMICRAKATLRKGLAENYGDAPSLV